VAEKRCFPDLGRRAWRAHSVREALGPQASKSRTPLVRMVKSRNPSQRWIRSVRQRIAETLSTIPTGGHGFEHPRAGFQRPRAPETVRRGEGRGLLTCKEEANGIKKWAYSFIHGIFLVRFDDKKHSICDKGAHRPHPLSKRVDHLREHGVSTRAQLASPVRLFFGTRSNCSGSKRTEG